MFPHTGSLPDGGAVRTAHLKHRQTRLHVVGSFSYKLQV